MLNEAERRGLETALYNLDQPVVLGYSTEEEFNLANADSRAARIAYRQGLKRGAVEAIAMVLGYEHNVNQLWGTTPLTIERGKYGRYDRKES